MKTITSQKKIIAVGIMLTILFSGCVNEAPEKNQNGKNVYNSWNSSMTMLIRDYFDIPFLFNTWLETPEELRNDVEDALFPYYKIRQFNENEWGLYNANELAYYITKNEHTLSEPGANWTVKIYIQYFYSMEENYYPSNSSLTSFQSVPTTLHISYVQPNEWSLKMSEYPAHSEINIRIKAGAEGLTHGLMHSEYTLKGSGALTFSYSDYHSYGYYDYEAKTSYLSFEITNGMIFSHIGDFYSDNYYSSGPVAYWSNGELQLKGTNDEGDLTEAKLSFFKPSVGQYCANITCRGITEEWVLLKQ